MISLMQMFEQSSGFAHRSLPAHLVQVSRCTLMSHLVGRPYRPLSPGCSMCCAAAALHNGSPSGTSFFFLVSSTTIPPCIPISQPRSLSEARRFPAAHRKNGAVRTSEAVSPGFDGNCHALSCMTCSSDETQTPQETCASRMWQQGEGASNRHGHGMTGI